MSKLFKTTLGLRHIVLAMSALAMTVPATQALAGGGGWFGNDRVQGSGNVTKQTHALAHFTGVALSLPGTTELRIGNTESVTIETDDNLMPYIETVIEDGTLKIRPNKRNLNLDTRNLKIVVQAKQVDSVAVGGSGSLTTDGLRGAKLDVRVGGSGAINVKSVEGDELTVKVAGSGDIKIGAGSVSKLSLSVAGSGDVDMGQVKVTEASVKVAGSGNAVVAARDTLAVSIAGSGDVRYYGDPRVTKSTAGSGSIERLGGAPR